MYGIKISTPGHDVKSAIVADTVFSSGINTLKTLSTLHTTVSDHNRTTDGSDYFDFAHNLGYIPLFLDYHKFGTEWSQPSFGGTSTTTTYTSDWSSTYGPPENYPAKMTVFCFIRPFDTTVGGINTAKGIGMYVSHDVHDMKAGLPLTDVDFDSTYEHWMVLKTMQFTVTTTTNLANYPIHSTKQAHGLSYIPATLGFGDCSLFYPGTYRSLPFYETDDVDVRNINVFMDATDVWIEVTATDSEETGAFLQAGTVTATVLVFNAKLE